MQHAASEPAHRKTGGRHSADGAPPASAAEAALGAPEPFRFGDQPQSPYHISGRPGATHYEQLAVSFSLEAHLADGHEDQSTR